MKRIMIAGTSSGCGKTSISCALMKAYSDRGIRVSAFKSGPDYIDPMFHKSAGAEPHNLDSFFCERDMIRYLLEDGSRGSDISIIEGAMGFYDGGKGSAYELSKLTETKVILIVNCQGIGESIGAVMKGFLTYRSENNIAGFIFNRLPSKLIENTKKICHELGTEYLGYFPKNEIAFKSRHLGLVTAAELDDISEKINELGRLAAKNIDIERISELAELPYPEYRRPVIKPVCNGIRVAAAKDEAFCFIYRENIDLLKKLGCEIVYFSPLNDEEIPEDSKGLILSGGYPELYAERLSSNKSMLRSIKAAIYSEIPTIAECGGFMYLHDSIEADDGQIYPMSGVIKGSAYKTDRLGRFGYIELKANQDSLLFRNGESVPAHEFHYWDSTNSGEAMKAVKPDGRSWECGHCTENMYAGFPHIYFYSDINTAGRFTEACSRYGEDNG